MKRKLICICILCVLAVVLGGCSGKSNAKRLIMADVQEGDHPTALACDEFAKMVEKKTNGRIVIEVYHGQTLGTEGEQVDQVAVGGIDFARVSSPVAKYNDAFKAFQALYLYAEEDTMWEMLDGSFGDRFLKSEEMASGGIEGLCWFSGGSRNFYNNVKPISSPKDLEGLTLRVNTDSMFALLEACGAKGVNIAYGDIYDSISSGIIDGAENNWPSYISTGHYKVAPYITVDEHTRIPEMLIASTQTMESLSKEDQEIIRQCAEEVGLSQRKAMKAYDEKAIKTAEKEGCTITYLTESQVKEFQEIAEPVNEVASEAYMDIIKEIKEYQK